MKKIIIIGLVVLIILGISFYFWQKRDIYFFKGEIEIKEDRNINDEDLESEENFELEEGEEGGSESDKSEEDIETIEEYEDDCKTECRNVLDEEDQNYCLEICGFKEGSTQTGDDCEKLEGFDKNVCFKNQAVKELDYSHCNKIEDDEVLKESCKNRVLEEIVEKEQGSLLEE